MSQKFDRRLNIILTLSGIVLAAVVLFAFVAVPAIWSTGSNTEAIKNGNQVSACRAQFSSAVTEAQTNLFVDKAQLDVLTSQGLRAVVDRNQAVLDDVLAQSPAKEDAVVADGDVVRARTEAFRAAVEQSTVDPDGFRKSCNEGRNPNP